jgi:ERCC4-type nuclease
MLKIRIDNREQDRIKSATEYYQQQGLTVSVEELEIGDYIFTDGTNEVAFEFKTIADFITSIQSGRVFNQAINMAEEYNHAFVIIQGDDHSRAKALAMSRNYHEITYFGYLGAIASLNRFVTVIESYSPFINEAYYRMLITAKKCLNNKPIVKKFPRKDKNPAFNYLCYCIYGVSAKRAKDIVYTCHLKTMEDLFNLTHQDLVKIDGIGDNLADKILTSISEDSYES